MTIERNVSGLKEHAQQKRTQAFERAEKGIRQLLREGRPVNFENVAQAAGVSRAWLYNQPDIRSRIEQLRGQQMQKTSPPSNQRASDTSKDGIIKVLKERIKQLETENRALRHQIEVVYGLANPELVDTIETQQKEIEELQGQNQKLMKLLTATRVEIDVLKNKKDVSPSFTP